MTSLFQHVLLVEGVSDREILETLLLSRNIEHQVEIKVAGSITELLKSARLRTELKASGLRSLGLVVDADEKPEGRWKRIAQLFEELGCARRELPNPDKRRPPEDGLVVRLEEGIALGAWVMPNNLEQGMMEVFLSYFIQQPDDMWNYSEEVLTQVMTLGESGKTRFKDVHYDKARIQTWLAWQKEVSPSFEVALRKRIFSQGHETPERFLSWFETLFSRP